MSFKGLKTSFYVQLLFLLLTTGDWTKAMMRKKASCSSEEYCPGGWSVKRIQEDYSARTCDPMDKSAANKCPKPYMCVASKCGINFCCASDKMLSKLAENEENQEEESAEGDL